MKNFVVKLDRVLTPDHDKRENKVIGSITDNDPVIDYTPTHIAKSLMYRAIDNGLKGEIVGEDEHHAVFIIHKDDLEYWFTVERAGQMDSLNRSFDNVLNL